MCPKVTLRVVVSIVPLHALGRRSVYVSDLAVTTSLRLQVFDDEGACIAVGIGTEAKFGTAMNPTHPWAVGSVFLGEVLIHCWGGGFGIVFPVCR